MPSHTGLSGGYALYTLSQENKYLVLSPSFVHCRPELFVNHETEAANLQINGMDKEKIKLDDLVLW